MHMVLGGQPWAKVASGLGSGLDFANDNNFEVLAMADGIVEEADCYNFAYLNGCHIAIRHTGGSVLVYSHLVKSSMEFKKGDVVKQGNRIAKAGNTGGPTGAPIHLHIELKDGILTRNTQPQSACLPNGLGGNPMGWDDLVPLVDGWYIGGYLVGF